VGNDENWDEQSEDITMNGTTNVTSVNSWKRVFFGEVLTAGTGGENAGIITVQHTTTTANVFVNIPIGDNRTQILAYTVPDGKTAYLVGFGASLVRAAGNAGSGYITIRAKTEGGVYEGRYVADLNTGSSIALNLTAPIAFTERTDIKLRVEEVSDNESRISGNISLLLVDN
jgi:hypothetical protein